MTDIDELARQLAAMVDGAPVDEARSSSDEYDVANPPPAWVVEALGGGGPTNAGVMVNERKALNLTAVYACVRVLSDAISTLPLQAFRRMADGGREVAREHAVYRLLHDRPNPDMTAVVFRELMMLYVLLWGNAYALIVFNGGGEPIELIPIEPHRVKVGRGPDGRKVYEVTGVKGREFIPDAHMLHVMGLSFDGLVGMSVIGMIRQTCGVALAAEEFGAKFFANGAHMGGVLSHPKTLKPETIVNLRETFAARTTGMNNVGKPYVLEEDMKWTPLSVPPGDAQFLESREFQVTEFARFFRVPPHMIADLRESTNNNIEHQGIEFVVHSLRPWLVKIEQECSYKLFPAEPERSTYYVEHKIEGLLRGDAKAQAEAFAVLRQNGIINANEWRVSLNMNKIAGEQGDAYLVNGNMIPATQAVAGNTPGQLDPTAPPPPTNAPPKAEDDDDDAKPSARSLRPIFADAFGRIIRRELESLTRAAKRSDAQPFAAFVDKFLDGHGDYVRSILSPAATTCGLDLGPAVTRYLERTRGELIEADRAGRLNVALGDWSARAERCADELIN